MGGMCRGRSWFLCPALLLLLLCHAIIFIFRILADLHGPELRRLLFIRPAAAGPHMCDAVRMNRDSQPEAARLYINTVRVLTQKVSVPNLIGYAQKRCFRTQHAARRVLVRKTNASMSAAMRMRRKENSRFHLCRRDGTGTYDEYSCTWILLGPRNNITRYVYHGEACVTRRKHDHAAGCRLSF
jgi:hypothetical protein